jgi:hypothetical protein
MSIQPEVWPQPSVVAERNPWIKGEKELFRRRDGVSASRRRYFKRREEVKGVRGVKNEK